MDFLKDFLNYEALVQDESSTTSLPPPGSPDAGAVTTDPEASQASLPASISNDTTVTGLTQPCFENTIVVDGDFLPTSVTRGSKIVSRVVVRNSKLDTIFQATIRPPISMLEEGIVKDRSESSGCTCTPDLSLTQVQSFLLSLFRDKIVVGYDVVTLLKTLKCRHPWQNCRDLRKYHPFMTKCNHLDKKIPRSLESLVEEYMGFTFDEPVDCPEQRAWMALSLYYSVKKNWDSSIAVGYTKFLEQTATNKVPPIPPPRPFVRSATTAPPLLESSVNDTGDDTIYDDSWNSVHSSATTEPIWSSKLYSLPIHTPQRHFRSSQDEATKQRVKAYVDRLTITFEDKNGNKIVYTDPENELVSDFVRLEREMVESLAIGREPIDLPGLSLSEIDRVFYAQQSPRDDEVSLSGHCYRKPMSNEGADDDFGFLSECDCNSTLESRTWLISEGTDEGSDDSSTHTYYLRFSDP